MSRVGAALVAAALMAASCTFTLHDVVLAGEDSGSGPAVDASHGLPDGHAGDGAAAGTWCAGHADAAFCEDFDRGTFGIAWSSLTTPNPPTVVRELDPGENTSPPASAHFAVDGHESADFTLSSAAAILPAPAARYTVSFDVRVDELAANNSFNLLYSATGEPQLFLGLASSGGSETSMSLLEQGSARAEPAACGDAPGLHEWARVALSIAISDGGKTHCVVRLTHAGGSVVTVLDRDLVNPWPVQQPTFRVGIDYSDVPSDAKSVHVDDILVETP